MAGFRLYGAPAYTRRSVRVLLMVTLHVMLKRAIRKSLVPGWNFTFEVGTRFLAKQMKYALSLSEIKDAREYFDSLVFDPLSPVDVAIRESEADQLKGRWFIPHGKESGRTMLYFHGGGYAFYPKSHLELIALLADAANAATFALDYRLTPEHSYPAQLQDAVAAYRQLLASGVDPNRLVIAGDSAGGHLVMMTLFALRDAGLPLPALAIGICPWMDIGKRAQRSLENDRYDWVQEHMALKFGD
jgi:acetyl esterase/lipase